MVRLVKVRAITAVRCASFIATAPGLSAGAPILARESVISPRPYDARARHARGATHGRVYHTRDDTAVTAGGDQVDEGEQACRPLRQTFVGVQHERRRVAACDKNVAREGFDDSTVEVRRGRVATPA